DAAAFIALASSRENGRRAIAFLARGPRTSLIARSKSLALEAARRLFVFVFVLADKVTLASSALKTGSASTATAFAAGCLSTSSRRMTARVDAEGKLTIS